jgi:hypothetical protein
MKEWKFIKKVKLWTPEYQTFLFVDGAKKIYIDYKYKLDGVVKHFESFVIYVFQDNKFSYCKSFDSLNELNSYLQQLQLPPFNP